MDKITFNYSDLEIQIKKAAEASKKALNAYNLAQEEETNFIDLMYSDCETLKERFEVKKTDNYIEGLKKLQEKTAKAKEKSEKSKALCTVLMSNYATQAVNDFILFFRENNQKFDGIPISGKRFKKALDASGLPPVHAYTRQYLDYSFTLYLQVDFLTPYNMRELNIPITHEGGKYSADKAIKCGLNEKKLSGIIENPVQYVNDYFKARDIYNKEYQKAYNKLNDIASGFSGCYGLESFQKHHI